MSLPTIDTALALQIGAFTFALLGAWMLRRPGRLASWAFPAWLVSNPLAMVFMAIHGHWWLLAQHTVFLVLAVESTWYWLVAPALFDINHNRGEINAGPER